MTLPKIRRQKSNEHVSKNEKSPEKNIVCYMCDVRFTQKKALYVHLRNKHNIEPLEKKQGNVQCPECKNMFYDKYNLRRHCRRAHGASPIRDEKRTLLRGRIIDTNRKPKFILDIEKCYPENHEEKRFDNFCVNKSNDDEEIICDMCKDTFTSKHTLIRHISDIHTKPQNLRCIECKENFPNKRTLLQHTHELEKYSNLEEILPEKQNYKYEVVQHVQINDTSFVSEIYCNLSNREDANQWLDKFQRKNKVTFRKMRRQCQSFDRSYVFIIDRYRCQHNTLPKRRSTPHAKHTGCSATVFIRVYQHKNTSQLSWSRIRIKHTHNHLTDAAAKFRDPVEEVVNKFRIMFQAGKGPKAALNEHTKDLQLLYGDDIISDRGICPTSRWVYNFYRKMTKQRCEIDKNKSKSCEVLGQESYQLPNSIPFSVYKNTHLDKPSETPQKDIYDNPAALLVSSMNIVSSLDKYQISTSNVYDNRTVSYSRSEYQPQSEILPENNLTELTQQMTSSLVHDQYQKLNHVEMTKQVLYDFDQVISQIRCRVSTNPTYFLNAMRNFIQTYNSTLQTPLSLNSALQMFGKYSEFQMNQL